jgi:type IV pilus biogenesis protein CpaD/CtpE
MPKQIQTLNLLALTAIATLAISGCSNPPYDSKNNVSGAAATSSTVVFIDKDLRRTLIAQDTSVSGQTGTTLKVAATLRNITNDQTLSIQVQTQFFDANHQSLYTNVGSETAWQNFTLTPGQAAYYKQNSLTSEARSYQISVRYMNRQDAGN